MVSFVGLKIFKMITLKIVLITIALISTAILALSIRIVLIKDGKFPETHIGKNNEMKKKGIKCAKKKDKTEQEKVGHNGKYRNVSVIK